MGAPKTPKINELEFNGRTSNKKGAGQKIFCPRIKGAPFIRYFRVSRKATGKNQAIEQTSKHNQNPTTYDCMP